MTDLILFDLDGTLVDHRAAVLAAIRQIAQSATSARRRLRTFLPLLGEPVQDDAGLDAWFAGRYQPSFEAAWSCYPDVIPCLQALTKLPGCPRRAVLTNGDPHQQRAKLARFGLLGHFEAVLTSADLGVAKPDPAAFTAACRQLDVSPRRVLSVGDWLEGDVIAATRAGLTAVWLDRGVDPVTGKPPDGARAAADPALARIEHLTDLTAATRRADGHGPLPPATRCA